VDRPLTPILGGHANHSRPHRAVDTTTDPNSDSARRLAERRVVTVVALAADQAPIEWMLSTIRSIDLRARQVGPRSEKDAPR